MKRRALDLLASGGGLLIVAVLLAAGALLMWGASFTSSYVHTQLSEQQIYFPTKAELAHAKPDSEITPGMIPYLEKYAGKEVLTGPEAQAYANHFIAVHLSEMPDHGVYALVSAAARSAPAGSSKAASLTALESTVFQGTTLRGLLLEVYGFSTLGEIALDAAIGAFCGAFVMALLVGLGFWHSRRVAPTAGILEGPGTAGARATDA